MPMWLESAYTTDSKSVVERHESSNLSMGTKKIPHREWKRIREMKVYNGKEFC